MARSDLAADTVSWSSSLLCVLVGTLPVINTGLQFLMLPVHAFRNHYGKAAPYHPNVAVIIPAWNEGAVIGPAIERLLQLEYPAIACACSSSTTRPPTTPPLSSGPRPMPTPDGSCTCGARRVARARAHTLNLGLDVVLADVWNRSRAHHGRRRDLRARLPAQTQPGISPTTRVGAVTAYRRGQPRPQLPHAVHRDRVRDRPALRPSGAERRRRDRLSSPAAPSCIRGPTSRRSAGGSRRGLSPKTR